jgi:DNA-binding MarR family transcriptional regulator
VTTIPEVEVRPPTLPAELVANACFLLARIGFTIKAQAIQEFEAAGFSLYQYSVLATLREEARTSQATVADTLGVDRSQLVGILDELEERGLVERRRDPNDRRRHTVTLTKEGKRELVRLRVLAKRIEDKFLAPLSEDERTVLHESLRRVACAYDSRYVSRT